MVLMRNLLQGLVVQKADGLDAEDKAVLHSMLKRICSEPAHAAKYRKDI